MSATLTDPIIVGSLVACIAVLGLSPSRYVSFGKEVIGSALTVLLVVGSGPLVGVLLGNAVAPYVGAYEEVLIFCTSIVLIDVLFGSKNNPIVCLILCIWGLISPLDAIVEIAGQMAGGLIGYPVLSAICAAYGKGMGGPSVDLATDFNTALASEALASSLLTTTIALLAMTSIGQYYWVKQPAIAATIRFIVIQPFFSATGPAMNPMLATTYQVFANGTWPADMLGHYVVYWVAAPAGATAAAIVLKMALGIGQPAAAPAAAAKKPKKPKKA